MSKLLLACIILGIIVLILLKPTIEGYILKNELKEVGSNSEEIIQTLSYQENQIVKLESNLSSLKESCSVATKEFEEVKTKLLTCQNANQELQAEINIKDLELQKELRSLQIQYNETQKGFEIEVRDAQKELKNIQGNYLELAEKSARSICCKAKVDDPNINSYDISNNKIICSSEGEYELTC